MYKRSTISRKLKAAGLALAAALLAKAGIDLPPELEGPLVWAITFGTGWLVKESEEFIEARINNPDLIE